MNDAIDKRQPDRLAFTVAETAAAAVFWDRLCEGTSSYEEALAAALETMWDLASRAGREQAAQALDEQLWWDTASSTPTVRKADLMRIARGGTP